MPNWFLIIRALLSIGLFANGDYANGDFRIGDFDLHRYNISIFFKAKDKI